MKMRPREIIKIDFDGTVAEERWPAIGEPLPDAIEVLRELYQHGHHLILWTCREGNNLQEAIDFCKSHGIIFGAINENHPENPYKDLPSGPSRKPFAHRHIDDKNFGGFPGWYKVRVFYFGRWPLKKRVQRVLKMAYGIPSKAIRSLRKGLFY